MGELQFELLLAFGELFLEVLFEFAGEALLDLALGAIAEVFETSRFTSPVLESVGYTLLGASAGGSSLFIVPYPLVQHPSRLQLLDAHRLAVAQMWPFLTASLLRSPCFRRLVPTSPPRFLLTTVSHSVPSVPHDSSGLSPEVLLAGPAPIAPSTVTCTRFPAMRKSFST